MKDEIIRIKSITQLHEMLGFEKPKHPLISVIDVSRLKITKDMINVKTATNMYYIGLKSADCGIRYGRNHYDFAEGVLAFHGPNQVSYATSEKEFDKESGWMLFFHPDLIRTTPLGENIENYSFFSYDVHEALHLSDKEKQTLNDCVEKIREEYNERIDNHSQRVIVSSLELLLNYCSRFYERQFNTRTAKNKDVVTQVESILKDYYKSGQLTEYGPPSLHFIADKVNLSPTYLSDLLKKETGRSAKDHINDFLVEKAKNMLLGTEDSVSEIAYSLGFNYPHYFSRLFKIKTGLSPQKYRDLN
ncbi:helix-turn-helix transcriptional regulator [Fulvivirgaceae bacterium BMA10]|uniref:Helix-turn-helix transcriptional regulator n=1 Tax=Splendidivirga corallicola TaxID=3051826 RepID=A0ABT8KYZ4_9BACT|nr:helix-turn-helix transcriptional regulator [Fulvivirgaceae bacterium BMA10]